MVIQFPLFVSSTPRCNAEFLYIESGQYWPDPLSPLGLKLARRFGCRALP